jgi:uncharacterized repeat protein (TIGR03803 family)
MGYKLKRGASMKNLLRSSLPALLLAVAFLFAAATTRAQTFTVLYSFKGTLDYDGGDPVGGLVGDAAGNLYGTTVNGGPRIPVHCPQGCGTVFKVTSAGSESVLYAFNDTTSGDFPQPGLIRDAQGNLYGTTYTGGGAKGDGFGTVFKVSASGVYTVLYTFQGGSDGGDYYSSSAPLVRDSAGNLYGVTTGGLMCGTAYCGEVFKVTPTGVKSAFYSFPGGAAGFGPHSLLLDSDGTFYGVTDQGGDLTCGVADEGCGVLFKIDSGGAETVLYAFPRAVDGAYPEGIIRDSAGNFYGTTGDGGDLTCNTFGNGCGVVFTVDTTGAETILHTFTGGTADGTTPYAGVIRDSAGNLYGTTYEGGAGGKGTVYELDSAGNLTLLRGFTDGSGGINPQAGLVMDSAGNLYGTASYGAVSKCMNGCGVVFKITP